MDPRQRLRTVFAATACLIAASGAVVGLTTATGAAASTTVPKTASSTATSHGTSGNAGTSGDVHSPQPLSVADLNSGGANGKCTTDPKAIYCSTRSGAPSLNGNGGGAAVGKPCAGCVGKADNKNPPGQETANPMGVFPNNGYECDHNNGIGKTNPAHTGCVSQRVSPSSPPPSTMSPSSPPPSTMSPSPPPPSTMSPSPPPPSSASPAAEKVVPPAAPPQVSPPAAVAPSVVGKQVTRPPARLPFTGGRIALLAVLGALMLATGALLVVVTRRRRGRTI